MRILIAQGLVGLSGFLLGYVYEHMMAIWRVRRELKQEVVAETEVFELTEHLHDDEQPAVARSPLVRPIPTVITLRQRLQDFWAQTAPRSPELVAWRCYLQEAGIEPYRGAHRADGYTEEQTWHLNTSTQEIPALLHLRPDWRDLTEVHA